MKARVTLTATRCLDGDIDTTEVCADGILTAVDGGLRLSFSEQRDGIITETLITVCHGRVTIRRHGDGMGSFLVLETDCRHPGRCDTPYGSLHPTVITREIRNTLTTEGGRLFLCYMLEFSPGCAGENTVTITVKEVS